MAKRTNKEKQELYQPTQEEIEVINSAKAVGLTTPTLLARALGYKSIGNTSEYIRHRKPIPKKYLDKVREAVKRFQLIDEPSGDKRNNGNADNERGYTKLSTTIKIYNSPLDEKSIGTVRDPEYAGCIAYINSSNDMYPEIKAGDRVYIQEVKNWREHLKFKEIYLIYCDSNIHYLKIVLKSRKPGFFSLVQSTSQKKKGIELDQSAITRVWRVYGYVHKK